MSNCSIRYQDSNLANVDNQIGINMKSVKYELMALRKLFSTLYSVSEPNSKVCIAAEFVCPCINLAPATLRLIDQILETPKKSPSFWEVSVAKDGGPTNRKAIMAIGRKFMSFSSVIENYEAWLGDRFQCPRYHGHGDASFPAKLAVRDICFGSEAVPCNHSS